jgi:hypothetical protein
MTQCSKQDYEKNQFFFVLNLDNSRLFRPILLNQARFDIRIL